MCRVIIALYLSDMKIQIMFDSSFYTKYQPEKMPNNGSSQNLVGCFSIEKGLAIIFPPLDTPAGRNME